MSTKIYNGYKLPNMSLQELDSFIKRVREKMEVEYINLGEKLIIDKSIKILDTYSLYGKERCKALFYGKHQFNENLSLSLLAYLYIENMADEKNGYIEDDFDFNTSICLMPIDGKILVTTYFGQESFKRVWESFEEVSEYQYWDNTDKPEDTEDYIWEIRRNDWDIALGSTGIPSKSGFIVEFTNRIPSLFDISLEDALKHIVSLEERANYYAKSFVMEDEYQRRLDNPQESVNVKNISQWAELTEIKEIIDLKKSQIKQLLVNEIDLRVLRLSLSEITK